MTWITLDKAEKINSFFNVKIESYKDNVWVEVEKDNLINLLKFLKEDPDFSFKMFIDFTVVDYLYHNPRFQAVYILYSPEYNERIIVKTWTDDTLPSLINLWKGVKWAEREVYDMFGIKFDGHDNLVRMFLWETYPYHPLRKDFPKEGFKDTYLPSLNEEKNIPSHDYDPYHTAIPTLEDLEITERKRISKKKSNSFKLGATSSRNSRDNLVFI